MVLLIFFFTATPPPEIYTLSLHDALPIFLAERLAVRLLGVLPLGRSVADVAVDEDERRPVGCRPRLLEQALGGGRDRKSTRLNSSHSQISYAVFCLKKKKIKVIW